MASGNHPNRAMLERYLADELSLSEEKEIEAHLAACEPCAAFLQRVRVETGLVDLTIGLAAREEGLLCYPEEVLKAYVDGRLDEDKMKEVRLHVEVGPCDRCAAVVAALRGETSFSERKRRKLRKRVLRDIFRRR